MPSGLDAEAIRVRFVESQMAPFCAAGVPIALEKYGMRPCRVLSAPSRA